MAAALAKVSAAPAVAEDADFHLGKGAALLKDPKIAAERAVKEFQDAVNLAPWVYDYHFNLASALKLAGQFPTALAYCKYARNLALNDKDRRDAAALRGEIEAATESAEAARVAAEKKIGRAHV